MKQDLRLSLVKWLNVIVVAVPFIAVWFFYYADRLFAHAGYQVRFMVLALYFTGYLFFTKTYDALLISTSHLRDMLIGQLLSVLLTDTLMFAVLWILNYHFPSILPAVGCLLAQGGIAFLWCRESRKWYFSHYPPQKTLVLYDRREGIEELIAEYRLERNFDVQKVMPAEEFMRDPSLAEGFETVFLSGVHSHERNLIIKHCVLMGITAFVIPGLGDTVMSGAQRQHLLHLPILRVQRFVPDLFYRFIKRGFDIVFSLALILLLSPLMLVLFILIRRDGGPALYRQRRLTRNGKEFRICKFRSMRVDAEKDGVARLSTGENDERITPLGRFLRSCRLDELPQLFNILLGDMSFVGPRPERPEIAAQYEQQMPEFRLRLQCKAGLTGYAQVYGKYNTTPYDKLNMDLMYISHAGPAEDIRILFATLGILFSKESTEGVGEGQTTAMDHVSDGFRTNDTDKVGKI